MKSRIPKGHVWWEATKNTETNFNQLQRQVASQEAQLNEAESVIDRQQQSIEESADPIDKTGISKQKHHLSPDNKLASVPPSR
jgi:septal ring factor EnvC (AmiA/AmiB activator)